METGIEIYKSVAAISGELASHGIAKDRKNSQGSGYNFRGIDDVYNALAPLLAKHKVVVFPRVMSRECVERQSKNGGALFYTVVDMEFDFVSAVDGSRHTARMVGEAMDSGDKSSNKAMSAAYKYAAFQTFCIPTEAGEDAEMHTHEVAAAPIVKPVTADELAIGLEAMDSAQTMNELQGVFGGLWKRADSAQKTTLQSKYNAVKTELSQMKETA